MVLKSKLKSFTIFFLLLLSYQAGACLESIDPALGANPSFFNMSEQVNKEVYSQNISAEEKFYLLIHQNFPEAPLLSNILRYNLLLPFSCPPKDAKIVDKTYIHGAWVQVLTVMPSVMDEENNSWALPEGEVLVAHNYSIQLPRSATNSYPDCGTVYALLNSSERLSVYANWAAIGNSALTSYETNSTTLEARAELLLSAKVREDHYASVCYCCESSEEGCESTCCSCELSSTEVDDEEVALNHSIGRKIYRLEATPQLTMLRCPNDPLSTASGNLSLRSNVPVQSLFLSFGDANISLQTHELDIKTVLKPHNMLEAQALPRIYEFSQNMFVSGVNVSKEVILINFTGIPLKDVQTSYAGLRLTDLFGAMHNLTNYTEISCPLNPEIILEVPHWVEQGLSFQVLVRLSESGRGLPDKKVSVYYSGEEHSGVTDAEGKVIFNLRANQSLIEAKSDYDGVYAEVRARANLMVYDSSIVSYLLSFLAFLFILVLSYIAFRFIAWRGR